MLGNSGRLGATLTEVLMSILIMGIGVSSLATLFPLSVLRSVRANQLTVATNLRYSAEQTLTLFPRLIADPDNNPSTGHFGTNFVVDPIGWHARSVTLRTRLGNDGSAPVGNVYRFNGGFTVGADAADLVTAPDSWVSRFEGFADGINGARTILDLKTNAAIAGITTASTRAVLFSPDGRTSLTRSLSDVRSAATPPQIEWSDALPASFGAVGRVRIETNERRFSWLYTVRMDEAGLTDVDVVVFFRRAEDQKDELAYNTSSAMPFTIGSEQVTLTYSGKRPPLRKGGFVLHEAEGRWYRIVNLNDPATGSVVLTLDKKVRDAGTRAIVMAGIIDVFTIVQ